MEEYIRLEEEKAHKHGNVFNWQTATYGKIRVDDDLHNLSSMEAEFPAIVINDAVTPQDELQCKSQRLTECLNFYTLVLSSIDFADMALPPREQRHRFLRYEALEYPDTDIVDFEGRLARIHRREVHRVPIFDLGGLPDLMAKGLSGRMLMEHRDKAGVSVFTSRAWRRMFDIRGPLVHELILEFFSTFRFGQAILDLDTPGTLQFKLGRARRRISWRQFILALGLHTEEEMQTMGISSAGDFLDTAPSYTLIRDPILRYLRLFAAGRKSGAHISGGQFVAQLAEHFGLLTAEILGGLTVIALELPIIDMIKLPDAAAGAPDDVKDASIIDEGGQADLAPVQAPQHPPPPPLAVARTIPQRLGRLEEDVQGLCRDVGSLHLMGLSEGAHPQQSRDGPDRGLARPAPSQLSRTSSSQTHDPSYPYLLSICTFNKAGRPREENINEYWWRIYKSGNLEVLQS
ncbi:hypothetical protein Tco_0650226 [Tanacetum coccineum]